MDFTPFEERVGVGFKNKRLLETAFTHRSYLNENRRAGAEHNERLEFLGDAVLELASTEFLYAKYPEKPEGELTAFRAALVNTNSIADAATKLGMNEFLLLSRGEAKDTGRARGIILANAFEAVIGAIYLDLGYKAAYDFIDIMRRARASGAEHAFAVTAPVDGLVGSCGVMRVGPEGGSTFEIGYWFGVPYWGLGYASETARALMDWARDTLGAKTFAAGHFVDNPASGNVLRKLGFAPCGEQTLFSLARQGSSPAARYIWPEGATPVSLNDDHGAHARH